MDLRIMRVNLALTGGELYRLQAVAYDLGETCSAVVRCALMYGLTSAFSRGELLDSTLPADTERARWHRTVRLTVPEMREICQAAHMQGITLQTYVRASIQRWLKLALFPPMGYHGIEH